MTEGGNAGLSQVGLRWYGSGYDNSGQCPQLQFDGVRQYCGTGQWYSTVVQYSGPVQWYSTLVQYIGTSVQYSGTVKCHVCHVCFRLTAGDMDYLAAQRGDATLTRPGGRVWYNVAVDPSAYTFHCPSSRL